MQVKIQGQIPALLLNELYKSYTSTQRYFKFKGWTAWNSVKGKTENVIQMQCDVITCARTTF